MLRLWWPSPLYEARPYGALLIGIAAGLGVFVAPDIIDNIVTATLPIL